VLAPFAGAKVTVPALYIVGQRDFVASAFAAAIRSNRKSFLNCNRRSRCRTAATGPSRNARRRWARRWSISFIPC